MTIFLYDSYPIKTASITEAGFMRFVAPIAKVGKFPYIDKKSGKQYIQIVTPETLIDSAESFKMLPVTSPHPPMKLTADNASQYSKGSTGHGYVFDNTYLWFTGSIFDKNVIDNIKSKRANQLSTGYDALLKQINNDSGLDERLQLKRIGNHLSVVEMARNGSDVSIDYDSFALDGLDEFLYSNNLFDASDLPDIPEELDRIILSDSAEKRKYFLGSTKEGKRSMTQILYKGVIYNLDGTDAEKLRDVLITDSAKETTLQTNLDTAQETIASKDTEISSLKGQLDSTKAELEKVKTESAESNTDSIDISKEVKDRLQVWKQVLPTLKNANEKFEMDAAFSVPQIKREYLKVKYPKLVSNLDGLDLNDPANVAYLNGMYDTAINQETAPTTSQNHVKTTFDSIFGNDSTVVVTENQDSTDYRAELINTLEKQYYKE